MVDSLISAGTADATIWNTNMELFCGKRQGKKQDPVLAYFSIKGVVWVGVGNKQCPFLPLLGGSWKLDIIPFFTCLTQSQYYNWI